MATRIPNADHISLLRFPRLRWSRTSASAAAVLVANCHKQTLETEND